jgi:hypothetical protein
MSCNPHVVGGALSEGWLPRGWPPARKASPSFYVNIISIQKIFLPPKTRGTRPVLSLPARPRRSGRGHRNAYEPQKGIEVDALGALNAVGHIGFTIMVKFG